MKIKKGFTLCPVMGKTVAVATGELAESFKEMIKMNEPSVRIWNWIDQGLGTDEIYAGYAEYYGIEAEQARSEVDMVVQKMTEAGIFE